MNSREDPSRLFQPNDKTSRSAFAALFGLCPRAAAMVSIFILAIMARVVFLFATGIPDQRGGDMEEYLSLAVHLAEGVGFTTDGVHPQLFRAPAVPFIMSIWLRTVGGEPIQSLAAYQVLVQSLAFPILFLLLLKLQFSMKRSFVFASLAGLYPYEYINIGLILQEPTMTALVVAVCSSLAYWFDSPTAAKSVGVGILIGVATLCKVAHLALAWTVLAAWLWCPEARRSVTKRHVVILFVVAHATVAPWTARNYVISGGDFILVNAQGVSNLCWIVADSSMHLRASLEEKDPGVERGPSVGYFRTGNPEGRNYLHRVNEDLLQRGVTGRAREAALRTAATDYLISNPGYLLKIYIRGALLMMTPAARPEIFLANYPLRILITFLIHIPLFFSWGWACFAGTAFHRHWLAATSLYIFLYLATHILFSVGEGRHAIPSLPIMAAYLALGVREFRRRLKHLP